MINILAAPPIGFIECVDGRGSLVLRDVGWLPVKLVSRVHLEWAANSYRFEKSIRLTNN